MKKSLILAMAVLILFTGCATMTPAPKPECAGAQIMGTAWETWGVFAVKEAWVGALISGKVPRSILRAIAEKGRQGAEAGSVVGLAAILAGTVMDLGGGNYGLLIIPMVDLLRCYSLPTLHPCDKALLVDLFTSLELMIG